jgi:N,N'-diacetyllegionaminate synthase
METIKENMKPVKIGDRFIGPGLPVLIIAEAGVNHFGQMDRAFKLVDMAVAGGADVFKIQVYDTDRMISEESPEWKARMKSKELSRGQVKEVADYCQQKGILFMASAHDLDSLDFLGTLNVPAIKIGSGELGNSIFLEKAAQMGLPVILSTGMHSMEDVRRSVVVFYENGGKNLILMHCITLYPTEPEEVNLKAMDTLREAFKLPVGYSDHTRGYNIVLAAVARGASIIEKHVALEKEYPGTWDPLVSCTEEDLWEMVKSIRNIEAAMGTGEKKPVPRELESLKWATKSIVAGRDIPRGTLISKDMLEFKRPGTGLRPSEIGRILSRKANQMIKKNTIVSMDCIE